MSIEAFRLENFMAFKDTGWIEIRPVCLLFGANSSGKSAIIRALRLLKQSMMFGSLDEPLAFYNEGGIDLGNFRTVIHQNNENHVISYHFRCRFYEKGIDDLRKKINETLKAQQKPTISITDKSYQILDIVMSFGFDQSEEQVEFVGFNIICPWDILKNEANIVFSAERQIIISEENDGEDKWSWSERWYLYSDFLQGHKHDRDPVWADVSLNLMPGFVPTLISGVRVSDNRESVSNRDFILVNDLLKEFYRILESFLKGFEWIGPVRPEPERIIYLDRATLRNWRQRGLGAYADLLQGKLNQSKYEQLDLWIRKLGLGIGSSFKSSGNDAIGTLSQVKIKNSATEEEKDLTDVGFGASQVLPVLAAGLTSQSISLLAIEQPELHLHPKAQIVLANIMVEIARRGIPLLLETHSEHFLLRIQRWAVESALTLDNKSKESLEEDKLPVDKERYLDSSEIRIYFVYCDQSNDSITELYQIPIGSDGELDLSNAPAEFDDFFIDDIDDTIALARATISYNTNPTVEADENSEVDDESNN
ncbi:MAG: AAA family ATPase [Calditrichaeota bacterium]|nr:AAA family ATPase [Calditrichota bacterium]